MAMAQSRQAQNNNTSIDNILRLCGAKKGGDVEAGAFPILLYGQSKITAIIGERTRNKSQVKLANLNLNPIE